MTSEPTVDEIASRCAAIRETWTDEQHLRRLRADERPQPVDVRITRAAVREPPIPDVF